MMCIIQYNAMSCCILVYHTRLWCTIMSILAARVLRKRGTPLRPKTYDF